jgi:4-hydroxy-tetrahydrodipicolinate reductase
MIRVAVAGALGRMGRATCAAVARAGDLELVGGFARHHRGEPLAGLAGLSVPTGRVYDDVGELYDETKPDVVVDFTVYPISLDVGREAVDRGIAPVIGVTGWPEEDVLAFADRCDEAGVGAVLAPNFALGAVLMMRFASDAARYFPTAEVIELHHDAKRDKPSGTARLTAERIAVAAGRHEPVPIHSVRLRGLVAHQEVLFGGTDEVLTIRHDSLSRESFMSGVLLAIRKVRGLRGLAIGLDPLLDLAPHEPVAR